MRVMMVSAGTSREKVPKDTVTSGEVRGQRVTLGSVSWAQRVMTNTMANDTWEPNKLMRDVRKPACE